MSNVIQLHKVQPEEVTEASFEHLTTQQLIYKAATSCDLAQDILFDDAAEQDARNEARFEVFTSFLVLKVLAKRMLGRPYGEIKADVDHAILSRLARMDGGADHAD